MYLYLSSQMGIPAVLLLIAVYLRAYAYSDRIARRSGDPFVRAIAAAGTATVAGVLVTNMFGSRLTDLAVSMPFWVMLAVIAHLQRDLGSPTVRTGRPSRA
jgi:O-antigen ligase